MKRSNMLIFTLLVVIASVILRDVIIKSNPEGITLFMNWLVSTPGLILILVLIVAFGVMLFEKTLLDKKALTEQQTRYDFLLSRMSLATSQEEYESVLKEANLLKLPFEFFKNLKAQCSLNKVKDTIPWWGNK